MISPKKHFQRDKPQKSIFNAISPKKSIFNAIMKSEPSSRSPRRDGMESLLRLNDTHFIIRSRYMSWGKIYCIRVVNFEHKKKTISVVLFYIYATSVKKLWFRKVFFFESCFLWFYCEPFYLIFSDRLSEYEKWVVNSNQTHKLKSELLTAIKPINSITSYP